MSGQQAPGAVLLDVIDNQSRRLGEKTRFGDVDELAVGAHLEVIQVGAQARNVLRKLVLVHDATGFQIERQQSARGESVIAVVQGPQATLPVDPQRQDAVKPARLAVTGLEHLVGPARRRPALSMPSPGASLRVQADKYPAVGRDRDIAWRRWQVGNNLQNRARQAGRAGAVRERLAAAVADPQHRPNDPHQQAEQSQQLADDAKDHAGNSLAAASNSGCIRLMIRQNSSAVRSAS